MRISSPTRQLIIAALAVLAVLASTFAAGAQAHAATSSKGLPYKVKATSGSSQLIIAHTTSRKSTRGSVELWQRSGSTWKRTKKVSARFGYSGLALPSAKREGDGRTPMGRYTLPSAFGRQAKPAGTKLRYTRVDKNDQWCSKSSSANYNRFMTRPTKSCPAKNAEVLSKYAQYDRAMVIGYNTARTPKRGSAIFFHINGKGSTAGCVSVSRSAMNSILPWVNPAKKPRILIGDRASLQKY